MRVNLGCGHAYLPGWVNVDSDPEVKADVYLDAVDFVREYGPQVEELYLGHVLEHILPGDALVLLKLVCERLPAGSVVSAVTPDMRAIWDAYQRGEISNDELNASFVYSYVQASRHVWCYDVPSLLELFTRAGFDDAEAIDPLTWPPVHHKEGTESRWQCGVRASAKGSPVGDLGGPPEVMRLTLESVGEDDSPDHDGPVTTEELLLRRAEVLREGLVREMRRQPPEPAEVSAPDEPTMVPPAEPEADAPPQKGVKGRLRAVARSMPEGSRRREMARASLLTYREARTFGRRVKATWAIPGVLEPSEPRYAAWRRRHQPTPDKLELQRRHARRAVHQHSVQVVVLPGTGPLSRTLKSLVDQTWPFWMASVCGRGRTSLPVSDERIAATTEPSVVEAANTVVAESGREFVIFLRSGDVLAPDCLYSVAGVAEQDPLVDLVGWDDDVINGRGRRAQPRFRPSFSPEMLLGANYLGRSFAIRRSRFLWADGFAGRCDDTGVWDLLLRCQLDGERVARVPRVLSSVTDRPGRVTADDVRVVTEHLERLEWPAAAEADGSMVRVRWALPEPPRVSIVIPTKHNRPLMTRLLTSLARTDYPDFEVVVVDNGGRSDENEQWYESHRERLNLSVLWWDTEPFNYSAVNNAGAQRATGEILIFLNDDTEVTDPSWMTEMVGWATRPEIGLTGLQLTDRDGKIQHSGVILGLGGFADHVFEGMKPGSDSLFGSTRWYRNVLSVTGACTAIRKELFDTLGGFDERFQLCGSDVALGLDATIRGLRSMCSPYGGVRHLESATRGTSTIPPMDFFMSYWRYNPWMIGGDPYFSPNLSMGSRRPSLRAPNEPTPQQRIARPLGRTFEVFRQRNSDTESAMLADGCRALPVDAAANVELHARNTEPFDVTTVNWFIPDIDSPFYGGINTALRIADQLARNHSVRNRFVVWGKPNENFVRSALAAAFPALADSEIYFHEDIVGASLEQVPYADVSIATLWVTAYSVAHFTNTRRKFYLIQDFEPMFYPAGTQYALAEETYRLGLYGLCNTDNLARVYAEDYGGKGMSFTPAVDQSVFHANGRRVWTPDAPATVFVYARPGHWRNCWEMASLALRELKGRLGDRVRIVTAGAWASGPGADTSIKGLGLLDYRATGELYRKSDVGLALTVSKHPSYLPLELMACGVPLVAFDNPWGHWILRDGENCLLAKRTVDSLVDRLERLCVDSQLRQRMSKQGLADIAASHADWDKALADIYGYLCDPEGPR